MTDLSGIFMALDERNNLLPVERMNGPVLLTSMPPPHDLIVVAFPYTEHGYEIEVPDEDDNESLQVSESGDHAAYQTSAGKVTFRKLELEDVLELQLQFPEIEWPEFTTEADLIGFLEETLFSSPV